MRTFLLLFLSTGALADIRIAEPAARPGIGMPFPAAVKGPIVVAMTSPSCPISRRFAPVLARLSSKHHVLFIGVHGTSAELAAFSKLHGFVGTVRPDRDLARKLGATSTTEVFLVNAKGVLVYRGAISDQYGIGIAHGKPRRTFLADAMTAMDKGENPTIASTSAPGCVLDFTDARKNAPITWNGRVHAIIRQRCERCHRDGGNAPFPLETYEQVSEHAGMVRVAVRKQIMPPWFASKDSLPMANDASLSDAEKRDLLAWLKSGRAKGDAVAQLPNPNWPTEWIIGKPDAIFELPRDVRIKAEGRMPYVNLRVKTSYPKDRWVRAWEVRPTATDVVHHVLAFVQKGDDRNPRNGYFVGYVPGNGTARYPDGVALRLPAGATIQFQLHYTPNGTARVDRTQLALQFTDKPKYEVRVEGIANEKIRIPAGNANRVERAYAPIPVDAQVLGLMAHMHYRGKSFRYELVTKEGERRLLLDLPRYDFNWQLAYWFKEPLTVRSGSRIEVTAVFDNSADNKANPDPKKDVRWGTQSDDEMLIGYVFYYVPTVPAGQPVPKLRWTLADRLLTSLDKDRDGRVSKSECPAKWTDDFARLDTDRDGFVSRVELEPVNRWKSARR